MVRDPSLCGVHLLASSLTHLFYLAHFDAFYKVTLIDNERLLDGLLLVLFPAPDAGPEEHGRLLLPLHVRWE